MRRAGGGLAALCAAAALAACNTGFAPQWRVVDLRILAARAEVLGGDPAAAPFADPDAGESVRLTALLANPQGLPGLTVRWKACLPEQGQVVSPCLDPAVLRDPARLDALPGVIDLGEGASVTVALPPALAPLLAAIADRARQRPELACTLYAEVPVLAMASAAGTARLAVKTVRVTPWREVQGTSLEGAYVRNTNPIVGQVRADPGDVGACLGGSPVARPCLTGADCDGATCRADPAASPEAPGACQDPMPVGRVTLCALPDRQRRSVQVYNECRADGSREEFFEGLAWQWYATGGVLERSGGGAPGDLGNVTGQDVRFTRPEGAFTLWLVLRDGRGGEDWIRRDYP